MPYPDWHAQAISLSIPGGRSFTLPANPTDLTDQPQGNVVVRQTTAGNVTVIWAAKPTLYTHQGITGSEGVVPWKQAQRDFYLKRCVYANLLTGVSTSVVCTRFDLTGSGRNPANWTYRIELQEVGALSSPTPESPTYHAPGRGAQ